VEEGKGYFKQCTRCGSWVCPDVCWNHKAGLCETCAPDEHEELAAQQAQATPEQITRKPGRRTTSRPGFQEPHRRAAVHQLHGQTHPAEQVLPECGTPNPKAQQKEKFCSDCGTRMKSDQRFCADCGTRNE
jgi:hypothetical protein